jgi:hypothetical protein
MKALLIAISVLFTVSAAQAENYTLKEVTCKYKSEVSGKVLKPVVTWGTFKSKETKKPVLVLALAYIVDGAKAVETAEVKGSTYANSFSTYTIKAKTSSKKAVEIIINTANGKSILKIDGVKQDYLPKLKCSFATVG